MKSGPTDDLIVRKLGYTGMGGQPLSSLILPLTVYGRCTHHNCVGYGMHVKPLISKKISAMAGFELQTLDLTVQHANHETTMRT